MLHRENLPSKTKKQAINQPKTKIQNVELYTKYIKAGKTNRKIDDGLVGSANYTSMQRAQPAPK